MEHEIALTLPLSLTDETLHQWLTSQPNTQHQRDTQLTNVYFDTPQQNLRQQKTALRIRYDDEQKQWLQTLKTTGQILNGISSRHEWECTLPHQVLVLNLFPTDAQQYIEHFFNDLQPVFETNFIRRIYLHNDGFNTYEWAFDCGQISTPHGLSEPIHELEIELKHGELKPMRMLVQHAQKQLQAAPQNLSKAARGYVMLKTSQA